ncbi:MAG TPA: hypothetical protein VFY73_12165 [Ideonella sp.]|uniref:hypothetical protein n=1 Tax=Ideonella sp. TaxID=1929293 RepID=UPI002E3341BC|nr:hypothetical protein [Ideonella sp.]HEX5684772.1 hypothetical protein [Ideonella sp.]
MRRAFLTLVIPACLWLAGCDLLGIEGATAVAERKAAEGKAVGAACRHAGRAIEDCYTLNKKADKAAIYAGWREMDDYMRENKLEPVAPQLKAEAPKAKAAESEDEPEQTAKVDGEAKGKEARAKKVAGAH